MRQQSVLQVRVRGAVIGGSKPLVCMPMVGNSKEKILEEATFLVARGPDLLEWRADAYEQAENVEESIACLQGLREAVGDIPLIFTCRIDLEGGLRGISPDNRMQLYSAVINSGNVDLVDVELCNDKKFIETIIERAAAEGVKVILSHHNFQQTPSEPFIYAKLVEAQLAGADIAKVAVMPKNHGDVLTLLGATNRARNEAVQIPIVTMSMGPAGAVSRLVGGLFGSDITFALGMQASAPGQIPIEDLRVGMSLLYGSDSQ